MLAMSNFGMVLPFLPAVGQSSAPSRLTEVTLTWPAAIEPPSSNEPGDSVRHGNHYSRVGDCGPIMDCWSIRISVIDYYAVYTSTSESQNYCVSKMPHPIAKLYLFIS
jgi:hypothetical protein